MSATAQPWLISKYALLHSSHPPITFPDCLANSELGTDFWTQSLQSASASLQQLYAFTEKRRKNLPMRTTTIVHFGQKACAWGGATSEATRRNEVFCLLTPLQGGTRLFRASSTIKRSGPESGTAMVTLQGKSIYLPKGRAHLE